MWGAQVEFKNMLTRYPRSVFKHQLGHATSVATFKARVAPKRGNDAGLGNPGATAHQEVVFQVQVGRCWPRQELKEKLSATVCVVAKVCLIPVESTSVADKASHSVGWKIPPARPGAPGRKVHPRESVQFIKS